MPDNFDERLAAAAARLEQEAGGGSPAAVRARGDQRRRRHTATMAAVPVAVLAIAGTVGLTLRPSGGAHRHDAGPPPATASTSVATSPSVAESPSVTAAATPTCRVDLARHTLTVFDPQGKVVRTLPMTAGAPASPSRTGTFEVVEKKPSETFTVPGAGTDHYSLTVSFYIHLSPNSPDIYATAGNQAFIGKMNHTHGPIEIATDDAAWLYNKLVVGDTIQIVAG